MAAKKNEIRKSTYNQSDDSFWNGYKKVRMKMKKGKKVPNGVPEK